MSCFSAPTYLDKGYLPNSLENANFFFPSPPPWVWWRLRVKNARQWRTQYKHTQSVQGPADEMITIVSINYWVPSNSWLTQHTKIIMRFFRSSQFQNFILPNRSLAVGNPEEESTFSREFGRYPCSHGLFLAFLRQWYSTKTFLP